MAYTPTSLADLVAAIEEYRQREGVPPPKGWVMAQSLPKLSAEAQREQRAQEAANRLEDIRSQQNIDVQRLSQMEREQDLREKQMENEYARQNMAGGVNAVTGAGRFGLGAMQVYDILNKPTTASGNVLKSNFGTPESMGINPRTYSLTNVGNVYPYVSTPEGMTASAANMGSLAPLSPMAMAAPTASGFGPLTLPFVEAVGEGLASEAVTSTGSMLAPYLATQATTPAVGMGMGALAGEGAGAAGSAVAGAEAGSSIGPWGTVIGTILGGLIGSIFGGRNG